MLVAPLCNFQIIIITAGSQNTLFPAYRLFIQILQIIFRLSLQCLFQRFHDLLCSRGAEDGIHLRDFLLDLVMVSLSQTARYDQRLQLSAYPALSHLQDGINTLFLGVTDKAAGIDDHCICLFFIICDLISLLREHTEHHLRIHQVFITSKGNKQ